MVRIYRLLLVSYATVCASFASCGSRVDLRTEAAGEERLDTGARVTAGVRVGKHFKVEIHESGIVTGGNMRVVEKMVEVDW
jgi:hypothetical protein